MIEFYMNRRQTNKKLILQLGMELARYLQENTEGDFHISDLCIEGKGPESRLIRIIYRDVDLHQIQINDPTEEGQLEQGLKELYRRYEYVPAKLR